MTYQCSSSKMPPWSYSSLTAFETCPKRYYLTRVAKKVVEPQTEATIWGNKVHGCLEARIKSGTALPEYLQAYEPMAAKIASREGKRIVEERMTLDRNFRPTKWTDATAWCRGIIDVGVVGSETATLLDWKTGKRKLDSDQLKLFAGFAFAHYPWVQKVKTGFIWLKENLIDKETFTREQIGDIWNEFIPRVQRLEIAYTEDKWPAKPSGLCRSWCPVGKANCDFCGK